MDELIIKTHDFEEAKNKLKEFSEKQPEELEITTVAAEDDFFGLVVGDHKVTGNELNERLGVIQNHLKDLNAININTIKEFGKVYQALEALDKDYIQAILVSIKATEKTSSRIQETNKDIGIIIENQKKTLANLNNFKNTLDKYEHLKDVDEMWGNIEKINQSFEDIKSKISSYEVHINKQQDEINNILKEIFNEKGYINEKNLIEKIKFSNLLALVSLSISMILIVVMFLRG